MTCTWRVPARPASDVHRMHVTATVRLCEPGSGPARTATREFSALPDGLRAMTEWLCGHGVTAAAMEGTGVYWKAPFEALEDAGIQADLHHAQQVKQIRGKKTDVNDEDGTWLHLVLMIEVQGEVDHLMALRVRNYVDNHHMELWRGRRFGAADRLAPVLPIVIHTGPSRWTAAVRVIDLVTPGASEGVAADVSSRAGRLYAGDGYLTVDTMALREDALRRDNAAALLAGLCNPELERIPAQAAALRARLDAPELRPLLETVLAWVQHVARRNIGLDLGIEDMAEVDRLHESGELEAFFAARRRAYEDRYRAEGVARGIEQGIEQGIERGIEQGIERVSNGVSNRGLPPSGNCCAGWRRASSTRRPPGGWPDCSPGSATPTIWRRRGTGSSTAPRERS